MSTLRLMVTVQCCQRAAAIPTILRHQKCHFIGTTPSDARQRETRQKLRLLTCELNRRQSSLVPDDHPRAVYLREDKAGEKVVEFLTTHVFGADRIEALRAS